MKISVSSNDVGVIIAKGERRTGLLEDDGVLLPLDVPEDAVEGIRECGTIPKASVTGGKTMFASVKTGRSDDEEFEFDVVFERD